MPGIEPVLKVLLQEDGNALESATKSLATATQKVSDFGGSVADLGGKVTGAASTVTGYFTGAPAAPAKSKWRWGFRGEVTGSVYSGSHISKPTVAS